MSLTQKTSQGFVNTNFQQQRFHMETHIVYGCAEAAALLASITVYHGSSRSSADNISKNCTKMVKKVKIVEFHDHIWNHHEKCIQISTNMPGSGSLICEIHVKITEI